MGLFSKKKNGDYLVQIVDSLATLKSDSSHMKDSFKDHKDAECERRKLDRQWQRGVDTKLQKSIECPKAEQINDIQDDVDVLKSDKKGIKMTWKILVGVASVTAVILGILWRLGLL